MDSKRDSKMPGGAGREALSEKRIYAAEVAVKNLHTGLSCPAPPGIVLAMPLEKNLAGRPKNQTTKG